MTGKRHALGRGLAALLGEDGSDNKEFNTNNDTNFIKEVPLNLIIPDKNQPRKNINVEELEELTQSIKEYGVLQPIIVQRNSENLYEIIAGERRWRASKKAGLETMPIIEHNLNTLDRMKVSLVENIQRVELSPLEEAIAYENLIELYNFTQETLASTLGKSRSYIANILRLNKLSPEVKESLDRGVITYGHARCLIGLKDAKNYLDLIVKNKLNVRETEKILRKNSKNQKSIDSRKIEKGKSNTDVELIKEALENTLDTSVDVLLKEKKIVIYFENMNQFDAILTKIG